MKKILFLLVAMMLFLAACGGTEEDANASDQGSEDSAEKTENNEEDSTEEETEEPEDKVYGVGDTVNLGDAEVTFTNAYYTEPDEYLEAENGAVLSIDFETTNTGDESLYIGSEEFTISVEGTQYSEYFGIDGFMNENISSGNKITGTINYDVPEADSYKIVYEPTFTWDSDTVEFEVSPE